MKTLENVVVLSLEDYEQLMKNQKPEELEVGKWYWVDRNGYVTNDSKALVLFQGQGIQTFGFSHDGNYTVNYGMINTFCNPKYTYTKSSPFEVFEALKKHALSLGFEGKFSFTEVEPTLFKCDGITIFNNGIWDKPKPKIDYSKLKTGSVVKLKLKISSEITMASKDYFNEENEYTIVVIKSTMQVSQKGVSDFKNHTYCTLCDNEGNFIHVVDSIKNKVTEVISY